MCGFAFRRYSYHFPELAKIVTENYKYAKVAQFIKDRKSLNEEDSLEKLEEILMDSAAAQAIIDASKMSMGMDISVVDLINIEMFATRVVRLSEYRKRLAEYLHAKMTSVAPNLQVLIGDQVGARLISHAGSLTNLAKYPSSTVQILGAEKALFRALKSRTNTPKYGLLYHSTYIGRAGLKNKGRISRFLANKCSIASRIDCFLGKFCIISEHLPSPVETKQNYFEFTENPTSVYGDSLKQQVEDRLKFYESGEAPRKNVEVMEEAMALAAAEAPAQDTTTKKKKKKNKRKAEELDEATENGNGTLNSTNGDAEETNGEPKKKKKKKKNKNKESDE